MAFRLAIVLTSEYIKHNYLDMQICQQPLSQQILYLALYRFRDSHFPLILDDIDPVVLRLLRFDAVAMDSWCNFHNF